jgi:tetratricopeptide (TPR) repeat protein
MKLLRRFVASLSEGFGVFRALAPFWRMLRGLWTSGPLRLLSGAVAVLIRSFWVVIRGIAALDFRLFLQGLPALTAAGAALAIAIIAMSTPAQELETRYTERAKAAMRAKNYPEALACYERLAQMKSDQPEVLFDTAFAANAAGNPERCLLLMQQLAGPDKLGYPKAHFWHAVRLMVIPGDVRQNRQLAEAHILLALEGGVEDKEAAHGLLGELYLSKGLFDQAEPHLLIAVKTKTQVRLRLAHLYWARGNLTRARTEAQQAVNLYSTAAKADLFAHLARLKWAEALVFLEDFPQAVTILDEGLTGTRENLYRSAIAGVYVSWFDFLTRAANPNPGLRMMTLERGLQYDPKNVALLDRLLGVTGIKGTFDLSATAIAAAISWGSALPGPQLASAVYVANRSQADEGREMLRKLLAAGHVTSQVHFIVGTDAMDNGRHKEAQLHFERALELSPDMPVVANNLAWLIFKTDAAKLDRALDLANLAVKNAPKETNFLDTRGHILFKMAMQLSDPKEAELKLKQALSDLEAALPRSPNSEGLHRTLAEVYARLESPRMAAEHRLLADQLAAKKDKK